jgi:hypothetical protein
MFVADSREEISVVHHCRFLIIPDFVKKKSSLHVS